MRPKMVMLKKVYLEQSISVGSKLLVKPYRGTIYLEAKEKFTVILHKCKLQ